MVASEERGQRFPLGFLNPEREGLLEAHHVMVTETDSSHCQSCQSVDLKTFTSEIAIRFPGIEGLHKSIVWAFPELFVCLDCGATRFILPERELEVLRTGAPVKGAAVWLGDEEKGGPYSQS